MVGVKRSLRSAFLPAAANNFTEYASISKSSMVYFPFKTNQGYVLIRCLIKAYIDKNTHVPCGDPLLN